MCLKAFEFIKVDTPFRHEVFKAHDRKTALGSLPGQLTSDYYVGAGDGTAPLEANAHCKYPQVLITHGGIDQDQDSDEYLPS